MLYMLADHHLDPKLGYDIGWDCARMLGFVWSDAHKLERDGFDAGVGHFGTRHFCDDLYVKKWMQIRHSAWKRGIRVEDDVTPGYLASINAYSCPITRVPLTRGTQLSTDWSIDRVNNKIGYTTRNLVVMSALANTEKGALDARQIYCALKYRRGRHLAESQLDFEAWMRMVVMTAIATTDTELDIPFLFYPPRRMWMRNRVYVRMTALFSTVLLIGELAPRSLRCRTAKPSRFEKAWGQFYEATFYAVSRACAKSGDRIQTGFTKHQIEDASGDNILQTRYQKLLTQGFAELPDRLLGIREHRGASGIVMYSIGDTPKQA